MRGYSAIGLVNTKSDPNVGGALRAAHCYGAALVVIEGARYQRQSSDTTKMTRHVPLIQTADLFESLPLDCVPIAVEFLPDARPLPSFVHPERAMYIFGPENGSVPERILNRCKDVLFVPTDYCMNLACTVNVVLYDRLVKRNHHATNPTQVEVLAFGERQTKSKQESESLKIIFYKAQLLARAKRVPTR